MKTAAGITRTPRRQHEKSFKAELVAQCMLPGASVAVVALAGGINANLLFNWRRDHLRSQRLSSATSSSSAVLVPVHVDSAMDVDAGKAQSSVPSPASTALAVATRRSARTAGIIEIEIEIDIAGAQLRLCGPVDEASLCSVLRALRQST